MPLMGLEGPRMSMPRPEARYILPAARPGDPRAEPRLGIRMGRPTGRPPTSNARDSTFCAEALEGALQRYDKPRTLKPKFALHNPHKV
jgi:hypothetical protein